MSGSALTAPTTAIYAPRCSRCCRRERNQRIVASTSRPSSSARPTKQAASTRVRATDQHTMEQSSTSEADDPQQQEIGRAEVNQLARMMPDPEEDELFDDGTPEMDSPNWQYDTELFEQQGLTSGLLFDDSSQHGFDDQYMDQDLDMAGGDYDYIDDLEDPSDYDVWEVSQGIEQLAYHLDARQRWEAEKAEDRAITLHHEQIGRGVNKFAQTIATACHMSDVDAAKNQIGGEVNPTSSWVLAHFRLEDDWEEFAELVQEIEADQNYKEIKRIEEADLGMFQNTGFLDDSDSFEPLAQALPSAHFPPPPSEASQQQQLDLEEPVVQVKSRVKGKARSEEENKGSKDPFLDPLLDCIPGSEAMADADLQEFLGLEDPSSLDPPSLLDSSVDQDAAESRGDTAESVADTANVPDGPNVAPVPDASADLSDLTVEPRDQDNDDDD